MAGRLHHRCDLTVWRYYEARIDGYRLQPKIDGARYVRPGEAVWLPRVQKVSALGDGMLHLLGGERFGDGQMPQDFWPIKVAFLHPPHQGSDLHVLRQL